MADSHGEGDTLTLYSRLDCPLCESFQAALEAWLQTSAPDTRLAVIDIDTDRSLLEKYCWRVPVLADAGGVLCEEHFDPNSVLARRADRAP